MSHITSTIQFLDELADRLDRWADETLAGSWSTHQVEANRAAASDCRRQAAQLRRMTETQIEAWAFEQSHADDQSAFGTGDGIVWAKLASRDQPPAGPGHRNVRPLYAGDPVKEPTP